ncbi:MAG: hypothetical protein H6509_15280 [Bryobacterales bacterium]|nr:hypothetical protein [Bryobacterales bacterium]
MSTFEYCHPTSHLAEWSRPESELWHEEEDQRKLAEETFAELVEEFRAARAQQTLTASEQPEFIAKLHEHAERWGAETKHISSPSLTMEHPSYQAVLGMAQDDKKQVIRFLLSDMQKNERPWFWALSYLTGDNPIKREDAGQLDKMIESWVRWSKKEGIF